MSVVLEKIETWVIDKDEPDFIASHIRCRLNSFKGLPVVCFDYFDTLVIRHVEPEDTKLLATRLLGRLLREVFSGTELYNIRKKLEKELCEQNDANGRDLDFNLEEFARIYFNQLIERVDDRLSGWTEGRFIKAILDIEIAVERQVQTPCKESINVLRTLRGGRGIIVLVSDFYIPGRYFKKMLKSHKLHDVFDQIYISADHGMTKGSGRLYRKICEDLNCRPEQMIMIGDNQYADIHRAREHGIDTIHVHNSYQKVVCKKLTEKENESKRQSEKRFAAALSNPFHFAEMGYSLWFFIFRLHERLIHDQVRDIFFFSKEGEFLKILFDHFQQDVYGHNVITSHYLLVSRKATFLASLRPLDDEDFLRLFNHYRDISLRDFLLSLNFEEEVAKYICQEYNLDFESRFSDLRNCREFETLVGLPQFIREYGTRRETQRHNFINYLDYFGIDFRKDRLCIVDVGWKGSIQDNIYHIFKGRVAVTGYYIGSLIATERKEKNLKKGLLFDDSTEQTPYFNVYNNNRSLFEMMLGASHGSADGYYTLDQYEQSDKDSGRIISKFSSNVSGGINVAVLDHQEERHLFQRVIKPLQDNMLKLAKTLNREYVRSGCKTPDQEWFAKKHARMVFRPTREEVELFEQLYHLENFGIFEYTNFCCDTRRSCLRRLGHLKNVIKDNGILETGIWPPIILRRLGIGFYRYIDGRKRYRREFG